MTLENILSKPKNKITLENIITKAKKGVVIGAIALAAAYCGGGKSPTSPSPPTPPPAPTQVTVTINEINASTGQRNSYTKTGAPGTPLAWNITESTLPNVDPLRASLNYDNNTELGQQITNTRTGTITTTYPGTNTTLNLWRFSTENMTDSINYACLDSNSGNVYAGTTGVGQKLLFDKRKFTITRQDRDGQTGPDYIWSGTGPDGKPGIFDQIKKALRKPGILVGDVDYLGTSSIAPDYTAGYGLTEEGFGISNQTYILVNPSPGRATTDTSKRSVGLEEAMENMTRTNNWCGISISKGFHSNGVLNPVGEDALIYGFIMAPSK